MAQTCSPCRNKVIIIFYFKSHEGIRALAVEIRLSTFDSNNLTKGFVQ